MGFGSSSCGWVGRCNLPFLCNAFGWIRILRSGKCSSASLDPLRICIDGFDGSFWWVRLALLGLIPSYCRANFSCDLGGGRGIRDSSQVGLRAGTCRFSSPSASSGRRFSYPCGTISLRFALADSGCSQYSRARTSGVCWKYATDGAFAKGIL